MRKLYFDEAFDGGVFNGRHGVATAGESWVGPLGALGSLESLLGLTRTPIGAGVRVGEALRGLTDAATGFWKESLKADGLASARELLRWGDTLRLEGWKGEGGERLASLYSALDCVSPGVTQRLESARTRLWLLADVRYKLHVLEDLSSQPRILREVLQAAASQIRPVELVSSKAPQDLQLIRPFGPVVAADSIAAALASTPNIPTVIVGSDPVLDAALHEYGLPTTGASQSSHDNVLAEILPLIIELGLCPADPQRALELLTIPGGPIRGDVARELQWALQEWPAIGSPKWIEAIKEALEALDDDSQRRTVKERLDVIFKGTVRHGDSYPRAVLLDRAAWMQRWLHGRVAHEETLESQSRYEAVIGQVVMFVNLVQRAAQATLPLSQVRRFLEEARLGMSTPSAYPRQAGLHAVKKAGGVVAPIERIVWWNYTRSSCLTPRGLSLSSTEVASLASSGIKLPTPTTISRQNAIRARRPFSMATQTLWLVAPEHEANGDAATPHPSWDEVAARYSDAKELRKLVRKAPTLERPVVTSRRQFLEIPQPVPEWTTSAKIDLREKESPSSIEAAVGCGLQWALNYAGHLKSGTTAMLKSGDTLLGKLAHFVLLERTLLTEHASGEAAGEFAVATLNAEGPELVAPLFLPGASAEKGRMEQVLRSAAEALHEVVMAGWRVVDTETEVLGSAFDTVFGGVLDLVVERNGQRAVIDLKWSGQSYRRRTLEAGTALQLASYSALLDQAGFRKAPIAYFIITTQAMLSTDPELAVDGTHLRSDWSAERSWELLRKTHKQTWEAIQAGTLLAPGVVHANQMPETEIMEDGSLRLEPPCHFCEYDGICGRRYGRLGETNGED